jgi:hypothetical protein
MSWWVLRVNVYFVLSFKIHSRIVYEKESNRLSKTFLSFTEITEVSPNGVAEDMKEIKYSAIWFERKLSSPSPIWLFLKEYILEDVRYPAGRTSFMLLTGINNFITIP